jgi:HPt (histidine-containing phosphotransfer) domain-containing protein
MQPAVEKPVFDRELLLERLGNDTQLVDEILEIFLESADDMISAVDAAVADGDAHRVERAAHSVKGALLNISADSVAERALRLEQAGRSGELELCSQLYEEMRQEYDLLIQILKG